MHIFQKKKKSLINFKIKLEVYMHILIPSITQFMVKHYYGLTQLSKVLFK